MKVKNYYFVLVFIVSLMAVSCTAEDDGNVSNEQEQAINKDEIKDQDT